MSDQITTEQGSTQASGQDCQVQQPAVTRNAEELKSQLDKVLSELENSKKEISGLNRKISEDEKLIKQKEIEKLQGIEREKAELELVKAEKAKIENEAREIARSRIVDKALFDSGIPQEFSKHITGQDEADIVKEVKIFNDYVNKLVDERTNKIVNEKLGGKPPSAGTNVTSKVVTEAQWNSMTPKQQNEFMSSGGRIEG